MSNDLTDLCAGLAYENADPATVSEQARNRAVRALIKVVAAAPRPEPARVLPLAGRR